MSAVLAGAAVFQSTTKTTYVLARAAEYVGTTMFYGALAFVSLLWPAGAGVRRVRLLLGGMWVLGACGTVAAVGLEGAWAGQQPVHAALRTTVLKQVLNTPFGREWAAKALLWVLALVVLADLLRRGARAASSLPWRVAGIAVAVATLRISGLTGHSRDTSTSAVAQVADLVHLVAISLWIGGLAVMLLGVLPRRDTSELREVVPRYSALAMCCVVTVVASGALLAWRIVGTVGGLTSTTYGHILLVKVALLLTILGVAYGSKTWVAHRLDFAAALPGEANAGIVRPFVMSVAAETTIVVLVLTVASFLVTADPGR
jgi:copper transport protein